MSTSIPNPCCSPIYGDKNYCHTDNFGFTLFITKTLLKKWIKMSPEKVSVLNLEHMSMYK